MVILPLALLRLRSHRLSPVKVDERSARDDEDAHPRRL
eukprot:COSAG06_NODE_22338_length_726_cov_3.231260_1_plen_37_part_10